MSATTVKTIINNVDEIIGAVSGETLERAAMAGGQVIEAQAKINVNNTFSSKSTGGAGLAGSIQTVVSDKSETSVTVDVGPTVIYGRIRELGGLIKPVFAKMLSWLMDDESDTGKQKVVGKRFVTEDGRVFAEAVQVFPTPYLRPAADESQDKIEQAVSYQLKKQIEQAASE